MAGNTTNFALTSLKNIYVLKTSISSDYGKRKMQWYFLIRKKNAREYFELFTNKQIHWIKASKILLGVLGEYHNHFDIRFEKITPIRDFSSRFKGMDMESFAALSEFITYVNVMNNMVKDDPNVTFEL